MNLLGRILLAFIVLLISPIIILLIIGIILFSIDVEYISTERENIRRDIEKMLI